MARAKRTTGRTLGTLQDLLTHLSDRLAKSKLMKRGDIVLRLSGPGGGNYVVECTEGHARVAQSATAGVDRTPLIEVIGDAKRVHAILAGQKDAREQFLGGGIRVRGDLRYFSSIALELELIKEPL